MKIALIYNKPSEFGAPQSIERAIKETGVCYQHFWTKDSDQIPREFDLYLRLDHGDYKDDIPKDLRPSVFYAIDTHLKKPYKKILKASKHFDIVFTAQIQGAEQIKKDAKVDAQWIPLGYDPALKKDETAKKIYDIGFVGRNADKFDRGRQLELLKSKYPNSFIGTAEPSELSRIYNASRIGFNSSITEDVNMRIFEILACGCFLLTNKIKNEGLYQLYEEGKHFITYTSDEDLLSKVEHYLNNEEERNRIAQQGYQWTIDNYSYLQSVKKMFAYIADKWPEKIFSMEAIN